MLRALVLSTVTATAAFATADDGWFDLGVGRGGVTVGFGNRDFGIRLSFADRDRYRRFDSRYDSRYDRTSRSGRYGDPRFDRCEPYDRFGGYGGYKRVDLYDRSGRIDTGWRRPTGRGGYF